ncbi:MAG: SBBP repeat-containing protein [Candidatus Brocadia sp.]|nr:SBBP repeat-containing protein [Candidatus Brocadia sp.]
MRNLSLCRLPNGGNVLCRIAIFSFFLLTIPLTIAPLFAEQGDTGKSLEKKTTLEVQKIQMPFIANKGQVDEGVLFYAQTFGGTVFVNKDGEIVYSLPMGSSESGAGSLKGKGCEQPAVDSKQPERPLNLVPPLERRDQGVCNITAFHPDKRKTCPQPPLLEERIGVALKEELVGAQVKAVLGEQPSITQVNYFKGNDPSGWKTNIPAYEFVMLGEVYEGIDLRLKAYGNNVEKLFTVKPGADPYQIKIRLSGVQLPENPPPAPASGGQPSVLLSERDKGGGMTAKSPLGNVVNAQSKEKGIRQTVLKSPSEEGSWQFPLIKGARGLLVNEHGELEVETRLGIVKFTKPVAYQEIDGKRVEVAVEYRIQKAEAGSLKSAISNKTRTNDPCSRYTGTWFVHAALEHNPASKTCGQTPNSRFPAPVVYGFKVAQYDKTKDLIIDPLLASTYLGGSYEDRGRAIAVDAEGNVFVAGETLSAEFPATPGAYRTSRKGNTDIFVSKFNSGLTDLLASTFLGGALNHERTCSIATDADGNVYVAGSTYSTDFPTTRGSYDAAGNGRWDVFVSKFNNGLTNLLASTFLGGNADEYGYSMAIDAGGNVFVTGETISTDFPATPGAYDASFNGGYYDAFISKFNSGLTDLLASTFMGGSSGDYGRAIAVDGAGNVFVTGNTWPKDFPVTPGAYNTSYNGGNDDAFVSKLNNGLTNLLASTFLGGYSNDFGKAIAIDAGGNVYVAGETVSPNFPTTDGAYVAVYQRGFKDIFVSKFNNQLSGLSASTLLSGDSHDYGKAIAIDAGGNVYVAGSTSSTDFPTTPGAYDTTPNGSSDVFVSKLNSGLTKLLMSTFQGGSRSDYGNAIAVSAVGNVYVTGETLSPDFPATPGAYNTSYHRSEDVFVSGFNSDLSAGKANK